MRPNRKRQPTPKGEAAKSLEHTKELLRELDARSGPNQKEAFVHRLNDFLRSARTVTVFLQKESGGRLGLKAWVEQEVEKLGKVDSRFARFCRLRRVSEHDCLVAPGKSEVGIEIGEPVRLSESVEVELRDKSGKLLGRASQVGPPGVAGSAAQSVIFAKYFFADWSGEDIVSFCKALVTTLESLVRKAYRLFP